MHKLFFIKKQNAEYLIFFFFQSSWVIAVMNLGGGLGGPFDASKCRSPGRFGILCLLMLLKCKYPTPNFFFFHLHFISVFKINWEWGYYVIALALKAK